MLIDVQLDGIERAMPVTEFEEAVRRGRVGPDTPVRSANLTQGRWVAAETLSLYQHATSSDAARFARAWARPPVPWATALLVGLCLRVHFWLWGSPTATWLYDDGARYTPAIAERGEGWRLATYAFLHGDLGHVLGNMTFLAWAGVGLETVLGPWAVLALFGVTAVGGATVAAVVSPGTPSIGASAADFGFAAASMVLGARYLDLIPAAARTRFGAGFALFVAWILVRGFTSEGVDNAAHLGGLLTGLAYAALLRPTSSDGGAAWNQRVAAWTGVGLGVWIGVASLVGPALLPYEPWSGDGLVTERPVWWRPGWTGNADNGWTSPVSGTAVSMATTRASTPLDAEAGVERWLDGWEAVDPEVRVLSRAPVERDGVAGTRLELRWKRREGERYTVAEVFPRGRYTQSVAVDVPLLAGQERPGWMDRRAADNVRARLFGALRVATPKAVDEAVAGLTPDTTRSRLALAKGASDLGDLPRARALYEEAVREDPQSARAWEAWVEDMGAWKEPDVVELARRALARFPADRRLRTELAAVVAEAGDPATARAMLEEGLAAAPGDRGFVRALQKLGPAIENRAAPLPPE